MSGMPLDRAINHERRALMALKDVYAETRCFRRTHGAHMERESERVWKTLPLNTPAHVRSYLRGYAHALWDGLYKDCFEFCYSDKDGTLFSTSKTSTHRLTEEFYTRNEGHLLGQMECSHYWIGTSKKWSTTELEG